VSSWICFYTLHDLTLLQGKSELSDLDRKDSSRKSLKKASSTPAVNEEEDEKTSSKLLVGFSTHSSNINILI